MLNKTLLSIVTLALLTVLAAPSRAEDPPADELIQKDETKETLIFDKQDVILFSSTSSQDSYVSTGYDMALSWIESSDPSVSVASGFSAFSGQWDLLPLVLPKILDYGFSGGQIGLVGNQNTVWVYYPTVDAWNAESFTDIAGFDASGFTAIAWNAGEAATGFSSYVNLDSTQLVTGTGFQSALFDRGRCSAAILFNPTDAYGYSALTNSWDHQPLSGPPQGHSAGLHASLVWTNDTAYGYTSLFSDWHPNPITSAPISGVAGQWLGVTFNKNEASLYDGQDGVWFSGPTYSQPYPPQVRVGKEVALVWSNSGAWAFDLRRDVWYDAGIAPGTQFAFQGEVVNNAMLLWNNNEAWGYTRYQSKPGENLVLDGSPVKARVEARGMVLYNQNTAYGLGTQCTWASQPLDPAKTYQIDMRAKIAVLWTDDEAYVFNCMSNDWETITFANPTGIQGSASHEHALVWTDASAVAYVADTDTQFAINLNNTPTIGYAASWVSGILDTNNEVYAFSTEVGSWATQQLNEAPLLLKSRGHETILATSDTAYGFSGKLGVWTSQPLDSTLRAVKAGLTVGIVTTEDSIYGHSAYAGQWTIQDTTP